MSVRPPNRYRLLTIALFVSLLILGAGLILVAHSFLHSITPFPQQTPDEGGLNKELLLLGITMMAGLPAIGIGTYLAYLGNQSRISSSRMKGPLLMVVGSLIIVCSLSLPIVVWWMTQTL